MLAWKGETLEEYWWCTSEALEWPDGSGPTLIVDDGGDATLVVHRGVEFEKAGLVPVFNPDKDPEEWGVILDLIRTSMAKDPSRWTRLAKTVRGVSEETTTGVHRLYQMMEAGTLLLPAIKAQYDDEWRFPDGHSVLVLAEGRLLNLGCATGHPSFVMSASFTNQVLAQLDLQRNADTYGKRVFMLAKKLDEEVARLHLDSSA